MIVRSFFEHATGDIDPDRAQAVGGLDDALDLMHLAKQITAKPCPFCGEDPSMQISCRRLYGREDVCFSVRCSCGANTGYYSTGEHWPMIAYSHADALAKAATAWNRRKEDNQ